MNLADVLRRSASPMPAAPSAPHRERRPAKHRVRGETESCKRIPRKPHAGPPIQNCHIRWFAPIYCANLSIGLKRCFSAVRSYMWTNLTSAVDRCDRGFALVLRRVSNLSFTNDTTLPTLKYFGSGQMIKRIVACGMWLQECVEVLALTSFRRSGRSEEGSQYQSTKGGTERCLEDLLRSTIRVGPDRNAMPTGPHFILAYHFHEQGEFK